MDLVSTPLGPEIPIAAPLGSRLISTGRSINSQDSHSMYNTTQMPIDLALMPVRCWSCPTVMRQIQIEERLEQGESIKDIMDTMGYQKICCRRTIMTSPPIVYLQQKMASERKVLDKINNLTVADTGIQTQTPRSVNRVNLGGQLQILDSAPPGTITNYPTAIPSELQTQEVSIVPDSQLNSFAFYMDQISEDQSDD